jgi:hypothetical protein
MDSEPGVPDNNPGETRYLTASEQQVMRRALRGSTRVIPQVPPEEGGPGWWRDTPDGEQVVILYLSAERRLLLRQELYHAVHTLEAQARVAKTGSTRQRALTRRAADLRSVADQLA